MKELYIIQSRDAHRNFLNSYEPIEQVTRGLAVTQQPDAQDPGNQQGEEMEERALLHFRAHISSTETGLKSTFVGAILEGTSVFALEAQS